MVNRPSTADAPRSYDAVYKTLHWVILALVGIQYFTKLASPAVFAGVSERGLNAWHVAIGPTILLLMLVRLVWRATHRPPPAPRDLSPAIALLSRATHWSFYLLLIVIPVIGWLSVNGYGGSATLLGLVRLPNLIGADKAAGGQWGTIHGNLTWVLLALIALHVAGALYHGLAKQDGVFARMMPFGRPGAP